MSDWQRLLPNDTDSAAEFRRVECGSSPYYWLSDGAGSDTELEPAEALAFAKQLPEVKALVEKVDRLIEAILSFNDANDMTHGPQVQALIEVRAELGHMPCKEANDAAT